MASFTLRLLKHSLFLCTSHRNLDDNASVRDYLLGLDCNLFGELAGRRDDNGPDIVGSGALVALDFLAELRVVLDDSLDDGNEKTECFTGTGLCLCNAVVR